MTGIISRKLNHFAGREKEEFTRCRDPFRLMRKRTLFFDALIRTNFEREFGCAFFRGRLFIAAVGGYGRKELYPRSDIDLLIVHRGVSDDDLKKVMETIILPLMDANLDVGYAFRDYGNGQWDYKDDLPTITSYLSIRFLAGSIELFEDWRDNRFNKMLGGIREKYVLQKISEYEKRFEKFNQSPYILEPNIKDGLGGLREFHFVSWIGKVLIGMEGYENLYYLGMLEKRDLKIIREAFAFLSTVRCYMHLYHPGQKEILSFEIQEEISGFLGYRESGRELKVENFMTDFYRYTHNVYSIVTKVFHHYKLLLRKNVSYVRSELDRGIYLEGMGDGEIYLHPGANRNNYRLFFKCFYYAKKHRRRISFKTAEHIRQTAKRLKVLRWDEELKNLFLKAVNPEEPFTYEVVTDMYDSGFIEMIFPEFEKIYHKMQFDAYHIYTVDMHSLIALRKFCEMYSANREGIQERMRKPALVALAVLLHDIGKGEGKNHCERGAEIIENIGRRMGLDGEDRELLAFLVRNHLLISNIAQRRDISDMAFVEKVFRDEIKNHDRLYGLYFLTLADLMSVGEGVWNNWKERLFSVLLQNFESVSTREVYDRNEHLRSKFETLRGYLSTKNRDYLIPLIETLPDKYMLSNETAHIATDLAIDYEFAVSGKPYIFTITHYPRLKFSKIIVTTKDEHGLFAQLSGALTLAGFNILSANINTRKNGNVLDIFFVDLGRREFEADDSMVDRLITYLDRILVQHRAIDDEVLGRVRKYSRKSVFRERTGVLFDNVSSDSYTIAEIFTTDRMGLLFELTRTLSSLQLDIAFASISTEGDRAVDTFYLSRNGTKVTVESELTSIRNHVLKALNTK